MAKRLKLLLSLVLTGAIVYVLYSMADLDALAEGLRMANPWWFSAYLLLIVPQVFLAALRWKSMVHHFAATEISRNRAFMQVVGAYAANLLVPSKLGEFVKGLWLKTGDRKFLPFFLVALEKIFDVMATLAIMTLCLAVVLIAPEFQPRSVIGPIFVFLVVGWVVGLLLLRYADLPVRLVNRVFLRGDEQELKRKWDAMLGQKGALVQVGGQSLLLWAVQLFQFWCMFKVFGVTVPLDELGAGSTLALFAGVLPVTVGGVGLRDGALLWYFGSVLSVEVVLSVGILS
ncbi:MAG: flippase-like domain-containing protein, partial [Proteobacteria bacterium]|nr:flippase-like domain-containing protein [Pseudomonadota bacterium]